MIEKECILSETCIHSKCQYVEIFKNKVFCIKKAEWFDLTPDTNVNHSAKHDEGKLQLHLVPPQIIRDIAEVRMYGNAKYGDPDNWKTVEKWRYVDALLRHLLLYLEDPDGVDEESGIKHYKHAACNLAFICEMESSSMRGGEK